jgi:hypothetical protein
MCNEPCVDDGVCQIVEYAGHRFHDDCFECSECNRGMLAFTNKPTARFADDDERPVLLCGLACREAELLRRSGLDAPEPQLSEGSTPGVSCANCMNALHSAGPSNQVLLACNKYWHMTHFDCTSCGSALGGAAGQESSGGQYYEYSGWPYCKTCYVKDFSTCDRCEREIGVGVDAVNALGRTFHAACFGCDVCFTHFGEGESLSRSLSVFVCLYVLCVYVCVLCMCVYSD